MAKTQAKRAKTGFTVIEISLFLAISGLMIAGIVGGASTSVARQRYNDSVNSFVEFLRNVYSEVENVQNQRTAALTNKKCTINSSQATSPNPGRSNCAIYGKLITFGESDDAQTIHVYDVVGDVLKQNQTTADATKNQQTADAVLNTLGSDGVKADVIGLNSSDKGAPALGHYTYNPEWQATIEKTGTSHDTYKGSILIVRSPLSGTVHTYVMDDVAVAASTLFGTVPTAGGENTLAKYLPTNTTVFSNSSTLDFCIGSDDYRAASSRRRNVRILADGNNTTAVRLVNADDTTTGGNKCTE